MEGGGRGSSSRVEGEDRRGRRCVKRAAKVNGHFLSSRTEPPRGRITLFFLLLSVEWIGLVRRDFHVIVLFESEEEDDCFTYRIGKGKNRLSKSYPGQK